ncbi:MAG: oligosaccharide flippase family protein [Methanomassiliicoccales archaeon]
MIGRKSLLIVLSRATSAILGFLGLFLITRYFSESAYGQIAYTMSVVGIFFAFADLGFSTAHIKRINDGRDPGECLTSFLVIKLALAVAAGALALLAIWIYSMILGRPLSDISIELMLIFVLYFLFFHISNVATATFDAFQQTAKTQITLIMEMAVRVPLIVILAIPTRDTLVLAMCYMMGGMTVLLVSVFLLWRQGIALKKPNLVRSYAEFAAPLAVAVVIGVVYGNIDRVSIGFFWSSTEVAIYSAAQAIMNMLFVFGSALSTLLFPTFSRMHSDGDSSGTREIIERGERYLLYVLTPIVCVFLVFPSVIAVVLLSEKYAGSAAVMQILSLNVVALAMVGVYSTHVIASNRAKEFVWISFIQLALLATGLIIFVPTSFLGFPMLGLRAKGAALALLVTTFIGVIIYRIMIWRNLRLGFNRRILWNIPAAVVAISLLYLFGIVYQPARWYDVIALWAISSAGFYTTLYLIGDLKKEDVRYFLEVLNPIEMARYLKSEIKGKDD